MIPASLVAFLGIHLRFPLLVFLKIYQNVSLVKQDQLLRALGSGDSLLSNPDAYFIESAIIACIITSNLANITGSSSFWHVKRASLSLV